MLLMSALGLWFTVEQPDSSTLEYVPRFQQVARNIKLYMVTFKMWDFGGPTAKGTIIYSNRSWIREALSSRRIRGDAQSVKLCSYRDSDFGKLFTATSDLKKSQAYPRGFGQSLAALFVAKRGALVAESIELE